MTYFKLFTFMAWVGLTTLPANAAPANKTVTAITNAKFIFPAPAKPTTSLAANLASAGQSKIDDYAATLPPHLRVTMILTEMENEVVSGDGVSIPAWALWYGHSSVATAERYVGDVALPAPGPSQTWPITHANAIYDGLVENGCDNTPVFPLEFSSEVDEQEDVFSELVKIGEFTATDDATIQPNGYWNFAYVIRASDSNGGVSNFRFKGVVQATCTTNATFDGMEKAPLSPAQQYRQSAEDILSRSRAARATNFAAPEAPAVPLHCDGNTGYSCGKFVAACRSFGAKAPHCIPVQTPGGGTNGSICHCSVDSF